MCPLRVPMGDTDWAHPLPLRPFILTHPLAPGRWGGEKKSPPEHLKHRRFFCISKGAVGTSRNKSKAPAQIPVFPGLASLCFDTSQSLTNEAFSPKPDSFCPAICSSRCFTLPLPRIKARLGSWGSFFWDESTLLC